MHDAHQRTPEMNALRTLICGLLGCGHPQPELTPQWRIGAGNFVIQFSGAWSMNLRDNASPLSVSIAWTDKLGKLAIIKPGSLTLVSDNPDAVVVTGDETSGFKVGPGPNVSTPDADPVTGVITAVQITAAALDQDGVTPVSAVGGITLLDGAATTGQITFTPGP